MSYKKANLFYQIYSHDWAFVCYGMGDERLRESEPEGVDHVFHLEEGQREDGRAAAVGNLKNVWSSVQQHSKETIL